MSAQDTNPLLAPLRPDLELFAGPPDADGAPNYSLLDPVTGTYHKVGWAESLVLQYLHRPIHLDTLTQNINSSSTLCLSSQDILGLMQDLTASGLTVSSCVRDVNSLMAEREKKKVHPLTWLLHHYLYFRIPLLYPDNFLKDTVAWVRKAGGQTAIAVYLLLGLAGMYFVITKPESYFSTLMDFFSWDKAIYYAFTVAIIKAIHEFSHAYTATSLGVRVRSMGVAFMIFWPIPFCDITDGWRLKAKRARARISLAGILAEMAVAAISLFLWGITPPGIANSLFFLLSSASLLSTLLVNLNPAMRFDGYYILSDLWGIENLQTRAFAMTKWKLYSWFLGLNYSVPEPGITPLRLAGLMFYSIYTWIYRIGLSLGIALLVYYQFTKVVGSFLFCTQILWFFLLPLYREGKFVMSAKKLLKLNLHLIVTLSLVSVLLAWLALPLPRKRGIPAVVIPGESQVIYAPSSGKIQALLEHNGKTIRQGDRVVSGTSLLSIQSEERNIRMAILDLEKKRIEDEIITLGEEEENRALLPQRQSELERTKALLEELRQEEKVNHLVIMMNGVLSQWDPALCNDHYIRAGAILGRIDDPSRIQLTGYIPEKYLGELDEAAPLFFIPSDAPRKIPFTLTRIGTVPEVTLDYPALASVHGGVLSVTENGRELLLQANHYRLDGTLETGLLPPRTGQTGTLFSYTHPRSLLVDAYRLIRQVLLRESDF